MLRKDLNLVCDNAMLYNFNYSIVYIEAKKLKIFGKKCLDYFVNELVANSDSFVSLGFNADLQIKKDKFLQQIEENYYDILFSEENNFNQNRVKILTVLNI